MTIWTQRLRRDMLLLTRQGVLVLESLSRRKDHPDAEPVLTAVREVLPSFSTDTVCRTLNAYAERGLFPVN